MWFGSFYGIYSLVFIVETDMMTQRPATGEGGAAILGESMWQNNNIRWTKLLSPERGWGTAIKPGLDPGLRFGQKAISNDEQQMIKEEMRYIQWIKLELNLVVGGISGKTCQRLFTQLDSSPRLAFTRNWDISRASEEHARDSVANKSTT